MNKRNKILVGCLALLLALSVGYALFSETVTINGTATAKGDFDITTTCFAGVDSTTGLTPEGMGFAAEKGYENSTCNVELNEVSFSVDLKYPGAARYFTVKAKNTGTIDAMLDFNQYSLGINNINGEVCTADENGNELSCNKYLANGENSVSSDIFSFEIFSMGVSNINDEFIFLESDGIIDFANDDGNLIIKPGETVYFLTGFVWNEDYTSIDNSANYIFKGSAEIPLVQISN